jgi:predicted dehydrogenase
MIFRLQESTQIPEMANRVTTSISDVIAFKPQLAVIANPAPFHLEIATILSEIDCHLLIEKPISHNLTDVDDFLVSAKKRGIVCQVGYNLRFLPSLQQFRKLIHDREIGRIYSVRCEIGQYLPDWRPGTDYRIGVSAQQSLGGGVLLELSHEIDYLRWIFGEFEWVQASIGTLSDLQIDVEDTAHLMIGFVPDSKGNKMMGTLDMDFVRHDTIRLCTAIGELGSLRWNGLTGEIDLFRKGSKEWEQVFRHQYGRDDTYHLQWKHFLECIDSGERPLVDGNDGLYALKIIEAIKASVKNNGLRTKVT